MTLGSQQAPQSDLRSLFFVLARLALMGRRAGSEPTRSLGGNIFVKLIPASADETGQG